MYNVPGIETCSGGGASATRQKFNKLTSYVMGWLCRSRRHITRSSQSPAALPSWREDNLQLACSHRLARGSPSGLSRSRVRSKSIRHLARTEPQLPRPCRGRANKKAGNVSCEIPSDLIANAMLRTFPVLAHPLKGFGTVPGQRNALFRLGGRWHLHHLHVVAEAGFSSKPHTITTVITPPLASVYYDTWLGISRTPIPFDREPVAPDGHRSRLAGAGNCAGGMNRAPFDPKAL